MVSLSDKIDILEVIARYSYTYDGRDAEGFAQLFTEDGIFEMAYSAGEHLELRLESRQAIYAWAAQRHDQVVKGVRDRHFQSGTLFDALSDEQAQTRTMVLITHQRVDDLAPARCSPASITIAGARPTTAGASPSDRCITTTVSRI